MDEWIYVVNPRKMHLDGNLITPARVLLVARRRREPKSWWLARRNKLSSGTRLWYYFGAPDSAIAAVGIVQDVPYACSKDPKYPYRVKVLLEPTATEALTNDPVPLKDLSFTTVQTLRTVPPLDLRILVNRAGL